VLAVMATSVRKEIAGPSMARWTGDNSVLHEIEKLTELFTESAMTSDDGLIRFDQFANLMAKLNPDISGDQLKRVWDEVDRNRSGDVGLEEFLYHIFDLDEAREMALRHLPGLTRAAVFCRIRPLADEGGHVEGKAVEMKLDGWDEGHVFVQTSHERLEFDFPTAVVAPETTQEETYRIICPELVDAWLVKCCHVQLLAYGQTGTGKTHTMFGTRESLSSPDPSPDWGIFPRVVYKCFEQMREACLIFTKCKWILTASAAEFYMTQAFDLLNERAPVMLNPVDCSPVGLASVRIDSVSALAPAARIVRSY